MPFEIRFNNNTSYNSRLSICLHKNMDCIDLIGTWFTFQCSTPKHSQGDIYHHLYTAKILLENIFFFILYTKLYQTLDLKN